MRTRKLHICRCLAALAVAATASFASAQHVSIPFDPTPSMYIPQAALDPPRPSRSQNIAVARGQSANPARGVAPATSNGAAKSVEPNGTRRAVLFAVGEFNDSKKLPTLAGTCNDMSLIYERLTAQGDVRPERIAVLADGGEFPTGVDRLEPTCANFTETVKKFAKEQKENDVLFIFASTHGGSRSAEKDAATGRSFLCPKDSIYPSKDVGEKGETEDEFVHFAETHHLIPTMSLLKQLQETSKGKIVVVIDACQDEKGKPWGFLSEFDNWARELRDKEQSKARESGASKLAYADSNMTIIVSCSSRQSSNEITIDGKSYGAFTYAFAEGLGGAADWYGVIDGEIKLLEAYNYASGKTRRLTNGKQVPQISEAADAYKIVVTTASGDLRLSPDAVKIYEKVKNPEDAEKNVKNVSILSSLSQTMQTEPDEAEVCFLTGYAMRLRGSTVKEARGKSWIAALACFERAGEEFTLFVDGSYDTKGSKGCFIYSKPDDERVDYVKVEKGKPGEGEPIWIRHGSTVVIDRIEKVIFNGKTEYRARISRLLDLPKNNPDAEYWVSCNSLNWDRTLAESVVASKTPAIQSQSTGNAVIGTPGNSMLPQMNMPRPPFNL